MITSSNHSPVKPQPIFIYILICTINDGIRRVPSVLLAEQYCVRYVVSWQQTEPVDAETHQIANTLQHRHDVTLTTLNGHGLSRNRNHAFETAISLMPNPLADAVMVIADDDERLEPSAINTLRDLYSRYERLDIALLRALDKESGQTINPFPSQPVTYSSKPRYFYPCSVEMTMRSRVWLSGLRFDERFGLGSDYLCAGEEDVFLFNAQQKGLKIMIVPSVLCHTSSVTTGTNVLNPLALRSKGALYGYSKPLIWAWLRAAREALSLAIRNKTNPITLFRHLLDGIKYIRK